MRTISANTDADTKVALRKVPDDLPTGRYWLPYCGFGEMMRALSYPAVPKAVDHPIHNPRSSPHMETIETGHKIALVLAPARVYAGDVQAVNEWAKQPSVAGETEATS